MMLWCGVKLVVQVKLLPDAATETALRETLKLCNQAACHASRRAFTTGVKGKQRCSGWCTAS